MLWYELRWVQTNPDLFDCVWDDSLQAEGVVLNALLNEYYD